MARRELSLPSEDRPRAKRLFDEAELSEGDGEGLCENVGGGSDEDSDKELGKIPCKNSVESRGKSSVTETFDRTRKSTFAKKAELSEWSDGENTETGEFDGGNKRVTGKSARQYAMGLVSAHSYTEKNLRLKLKTKGYGCDETDDAVEYLRSFGYINDLRLAQNAAERLAARLYGRKKIYAYLVSKGISREVIEQIDLSEIDFDENCALLVSRLALRGKSREQIMRSLISAGFTQSEVINALKGHFAF